MKIAFLGAGKMASALLNGLLRAKLVEPSSVWVADAVPAVADALARQSGVNVAASNAEAVAAADTVILCVKPMDATTALESCQDALDGKLLISIVTGLSCQRMQRVSAEGTRVVRAMPNTPAQVGEGATAIAGGELTTQEDLDRAVRIFESVGRAWIVKEDLFDAVTGLSGSGPAYVCLFLEALSDGGVAAGLPRQLASELAAQTVLGAAKMVVESGQHPAILREAVTSPGGTTAAALGVLEWSGVRSAVHEAVLAAADRSRELSE